LANSILISLNDSLSSRAALEFLGRLSFCPEDTHITLFHLYRKPSASEELMGKKFTEEQPARYLALLEKAKERLVEFGFDPEKIKIEMVTKSYGTVSEGIIEMCKKHKYDLVIIGRKRMSKAEEFVLGDVSVKLVRSLEGPAVLVVKSG